MSATICLPLWKVDHTRPPRIFLNSPAHRKPGRPWCWEVLDVSGVRLKSKHIFCQIFVFLGWILTDISLWDLLVFKAKSFLFVMSSLTFDRNLLIWFDLIEVLWFSKLIWFTILSQLHWFKKKLWQESPQWIIADHWRIHSYWSQTVSRCLYWDGDSWRWKRQKAYERKYYYYCYDVRKATLHGVMYYMTITLFLLHESSASSI